MEKSRFIFSIILLILSQYDRQVSALLDITEEALLISDLFIAETKIESEYKSVSDVEDKVNKLNNATLIFRNKIMKRGIGSTLAGCKSHWKESSLYDNEIHYLNTGTKSAFEYYEQWEEFTKEKIDYYRRRSEHTLVPMFIFEYIDENDYNLTSEKALKDKLKDYHRVLTKTSSDAKENIFTILAKQEFGPSISEMGNNLCKSVATVDAAAYVGIQFAYAILKIVSNAFHLINNDDERLDIMGLSAFSKKEHIVKMMMDLKSEFVERNTYSFKFCKDFLKETNRKTFNYINAEQHYHNERANDYIRLENVFQKYIINEVDLNPNDDCKQKCSTYQQTKVYGCYDKGICASQRTCDGNLWDCRDDEITNSMICTTDKNTSSRYAFIEANHVEYGTKWRSIQKCRNPLIEANSWIRGFVQCTYCTCICDNSNLEGDRYFNLRDVISNISSNYVVTDARFHKENNIIHIEIEEGELLPNAEVNGTSRYWKPVDNYTIKDDNIENGKDYHTMTWPTRTIYLDQLDAPDHVLTGLRFKAKNNALMLEIHVTPFEFETGKLLPDKSYWISNDVILQEQRTEVKLGGKKDPNLNSNQYLKFTTSDLKKDIGQNTCPLINTNKARYTRVVIGWLPPLSGAGIFHQNIDGVDDMLSLNLITHDVISHMKM